MRTDRKGDSVLKLLTSWRSTKQETLNSSDNSPSTNQPQSEENEAQLQGEVVNITLKKTSHLFGFSNSFPIQEGELFQVTFIEPGGLAECDGQLCVGDVFVRVNGTSVVSFTRERFNQLLQSTPINSEVSFEMRRGYPLKEAFLPHKSNINVGAHVQPYNATEKKINVLHRSYEIGKCLQPARFSAFSAFQEQKRDLAELYLDDLLRHELQVPYQVPYMSGHQQGFLPSLPAPPSAMKDFSFWSTKQPLNVVPNPLQSQKLWIQEFSKCLQSTCISCSYEVQPIGESLRGYVEFTDSEVYYLRSQKGLSLTLTEFVGMRRGSAPPLDFIIRTLSSKFWMMESDVWADLLIICRWANPTTTNCKKCGEHVKAVTTTSCRHIICRTCMFEWLKEHNTCLECEQDLGLVPVIMHMDAIQECSTKRAHPADEEYDQQAPNSKRKCIKTEIDSVIDSIAGHQQIGLDPAKLDKQCSKRLLLPISKLLVNYQCYGQHFGLSELESESILQNPTLLTPHAKPLEFLKMWQQRCAYSNQDTYRHLLRGCLEINGDRELVGEICKRIVQLNE